MTAILVNQRLQAKGQDGKRKKWVNIITAWYLSGKKIKPFCQTQGIELKTFRKWLYKLNLPRPILYQQQELPKLNKYRQVEEFRFVPVTLAKIQNKADKTTSGIELILSNGYRIQIKKGFIETELIRTLRILRESLC